MDATVFKIRIIYDAKTTNHFNGSIQSFRLLRIIVTSENVYEFSVKSTWDQTGHYILVLLVCYYFKTLLQDKTFFKKSKSNLLISVNFMPNSYQFLEVLSLQYTMIVLSEVKWVVLANKSDCTRPYPLQDRRRKI